MDLFNVSNQSLQLHLDLCLPWSLSTAAPQGLVNNHSLLDSWPDVVFPTSLGYALLDMPGQSGGALPGALHLLLVLLLLQFVGLPLHIGLHQGSQQEAAFLLTEPCGVWEALQSRPGEGKQTQ